MGGGLVSSLAVFVAQALVLRLGPYLCPGLKAGITRPIPGTKAPGSLRADISEADSAAGCASILGKAPSGAKAQDPTRAKMYGLKPVPFNQCACTLGARTLQSGRRYPQGLKPARFLRLLRHG